MKILLFTGQDHSSLPDIRQAYTVICTDDYSTATLLSRQEDFSVAVLDGRLPAAFLLCRHLKENTGAKIIFLCENDAPHTLHRALRQGADDFVVLPVSDNQLLARIYLALQKNGNIFTFGDIVIDIGRATVTKAGKIIYLSRVEYRILILLVRNAGKVMSREEIFQRIWEESELYVNENTLAVYIRRLRGKLGEKRDHPRIIKTMRGVGYYV